MNGTMFVISGFRRLEEAEAFVASEIKKHPQLKDKLSAVLHGDKPVVVEKQ